MSQRGPLGPMPILNSGSSELSGLYGGGTGSGASRLPNAINHNPMRRFNVMVASHSRSAPVVQGAA